MSEQDLLQFPCNFPIKVMGELRDDFADTVIAVVRSHAPDFDASGVEMRASSSKRYLSLTCTVRATSREQLDTLYRALTSHPMVKVVL